MVCRSRRKIRYLLHVQVRQKDPPSETIHRKAIENDLLAQENIRTGIKEAYIRFQEAFTVYETQLKSQELATQNYEVVNNRYLNDLALITDMLDASNSKLSAELQTVKRTYQHLIQLLQAQKSDRKLINHYSQIIILEDNET